MGWLAPVVFKAKHILPRIWIAKLDWDDPVPKDIMTEWLLVLKQLPSLNQLRIPRFVLSSEESEN